MRPWKATMKRFNVGQIAIILLISGVIFGILTANLFRNYYQGQMVEYQQDMFTEIADGEIDYSGLFVYILKHNFKNFTVFWILTITILGVPYMGYKIISTGFSIGFLASSLAIHYGLKGIPFIIITQLPHGLLYLPIHLFCLYKGFYLCRTINHDRHNVVGRLSTHLKQYLLLLIVLSILLIIASFLEAYVGSFFLKKALGFFM